MLRAVAPRPRASPPNRELLQVVAFLAGVQAIGACAGGGSPDAPAPMSEEVLLSAYAHNDYRNTQPLWGALELGFRGVEVDCFLVDGQLLVGHDRRDLEPDRTLAGLYLDPLLEHVQRHGRVLRDGSPLLLNIELKTSGMVAFQRLHELLAAYHEMLTVVENGAARDGAVRIVLVGWQPPLDWLARQTPRYVAVQRHVDDLPANHDDYPSHLLALVSAEYTRLSRWTGLGPPSVGLLDKLDQLASITRRVEGRISRVYDVPVSESVYRTLLRGQVDLIGVKDLMLTRPLLRQAEQAILGR